MRFAEVDAQDVVFNSHYLLYCDEACTAYLVERDLRDVALNIRLVASQQVWSGPARWGDVISVHTTCGHVGRTSVRMHFEITASGRACCVVETTYVLTDAAEKPIPLPDGVRAMLNPVSR